MKIIRLQSAIDFAGWREHARALLIEHVRPDEVKWVAGEEAGDLFCADANKDGARIFSGAARMPTAPISFFPVANKAALHNSQERYALLYRILWRLQRERGLMETGIDPDIAKLRDLAKSVRRDQHKMTAFVRFREVQGPHGPHFIAWFEPEHHIVEATADFFVKRFGAMRWSILTPQACAHWDLRKLAFSRGASKKDAPADDALEEFWRTYYASIFNPARLKLDAMRAEMPMKYWRNLPEAPLIKPLTAQAAKRAAAMIDSEASLPLRNMQRLEKVTAKAHSGEALENIREAAEQCRNCPLWKDATQTVFGEGPVGADVMFVGEQPGDQEDISGKPFVGPAGRLFDQALAEAEIERQKTYVTNAVKHFRFVPRGKRRIHQKPNTSEIKACRQWFERERDLIKPGLIVALGATAAYQVFGRAMPVGKNRGKILNLADGTHALITVHPSYLLRVEPQDKEREYEFFLSDLRVVYRYLEEAARAA